MESKSRTLEQVDDHDAINVQSFGVHTVAKETLDVERCGVARHMSIDENSPLFGSHPPRVKKSLGALCWNWYQGRLLKHPVLTKSITAAVLVGCADLAAQSIEISEALKCCVNWWRALRFFLMGLILQAPITHYYYVWLDDKLPPTPSPWTLTTLIKLLIDQLLFAPSFTVLVFFFQGILPGDPLQVIAHDIMSDFRTVIIANWKLWVPASAVNLAWCPPDLRVLYCNAIFFIWSIFLSILLTVHSTNSMALNES